MTASERLKKRLDAEAKEEVERLERSRKEKKKAAKKAHKAGGGKVEGSKKKKAGDAAEA